MHEPSVGLRGTLVVDNVARADQEQIIRAFACSLAEVEQYIISLQRY